MRVGKVVQFRLYPDDCLSILDILEVAKVDTEGRSFASCTSLAVKLLIKMAKDGGVIGEANPFNFNERMDKYKDNKNTKARRKLSSVLYKQAARGLSMPSKSITYTKELEEEIKNRELQDRLIILNDKKEAGLSLSKSEEEEYKNCISVLY